MADDSLIQVIESIFSFPRTRIKPGGYPDDMFLALPEKWREKWECSICYLVLKEPRECKNGHKYCWSCIHVWSVSGLGKNHALCPVCRVKGFYMRNTEMNEAILNLTVKCFSKSCKWSGLLKDQRGHTHAFKEVSVFENVSKAECKERLSRRHVKPSFLRHPTATGLPFPQRRYPLPLNDSLTNREQSGVIAPSSTSLPDITLPPGTRPNPSYALTVRPRFRNQPQRRPEMNQGPDVFRNAPDVRDVRQRLDDSRNRLQVLLSDFGQRLTENEEEMAAFQEERERRRQEQLEEVREIGLRLGEVATGLRSWFDQHSPQEQNEQT